MSIQHLFQQLDLCQTKDRASFATQLAKLKQRLSRQQPADQMLQRLTDALAQSVKRTESRRALIPPIDYPEELPIAARRDDIKKLIAAHQVVIVGGETGSGKTTQLPKICLELGRGCRGQIAHTQPRRIAARTVANRIAEELGVPLGDRVGYQVRFNDQSGDKTLVKLMTDGILLADIQRDKLLRQYDTIIIDEAHERSLNIDFLLGYLKQILPQRPDLKVIITSATIDVGKFSAHFNDAPVLEVSGRTYPVEVEYREPLPEQDLPNQIIAAIEEILTLPKRGDILIFLSGEREIREVAKQLRHGHFPHLEVLPLYARLSLADQTRVFKPHKGTRVVLATNVAETSITVPGVRYVIDPGTARISRYSLKSKVQRLPVEAVSQASANQRKGRCGRVSDGVCFRLYSEQDFTTRSEFTDPEILRTNLASVILQMLQLNIGDIRDFPFVDMPDNRLISHGFGLLHEIGAVTAEGKLQPLGRLISKFPVDPRLSAMLVASEKHQVMTDMLVIVAVLSLQDPRERPADKRQAADQQHRQWQDKDSDFVTLLNIWQHFEEQRQALSRNQFEKYCRQQFISPLRMREWRDLHHQLHTLCRKNGMEAKGSGQYPALHQAILTGFLNQVGQLDEDKAFVGTSNRKFWLFPSSGLSKKPPKWVVSGQLLETSRLFAHYNAKVEPEWIERLAQHLVKKSYSEPHYAVKQGQVMAYEKQTLNGLTIVHRKRCPYSHIDPVLSREIFIRAALVEGQYRGKGPFFKHNQALRLELEGLEKRLRRRDIVVEDETIYSFYQQRVPESVVNLAGFEKWRKSVEQQQPELLWMTKEMLTANQPSDEDQAQFPDGIIWQDVHYPLSYHFEPGNEKDGVTVDIPVSLLHQVPSALFDWMVPGILHEKAVALVKGLPKTLRRHFVPVPSFVAKALHGQQLDDIPLIRVLGQQLKRHTSIEIPESAWQSELLDNYYKMNFRLRDDDGRVMQMSRDLTALKLQYKGAFKEAVSTSRQGLQERADLSDWEFGELAKELPIKKGKLTINSYPALCAEDGKVALRLIDTAELAENHSATGVALLASKAFPDTAKYLNKKLLKNCDLKLKAAGLSSRQEWLSAITLATYRQPFSQQPTPRDAEQFEAVFMAGKKELVGYANTLESILLSWLEPLVSVRRALRELKSNVEFAKTDMSRQLDTLFRPEMLSEGNLFWLQQYSRYLASLQVRLEKLQRQVLKDQQQTEQLAAFADRMTELPPRIEMPHSLKQEVDDFRMMLEEFRVSLFSQQLKTAVPVSEKRLEKQWQVIDKLLR